MVNPTLVKKTENAIEVNENTKRLFQLIYHEQNTPEKETEDTPRVKVSSLVSKMAFYYEKIRNSVDYNEEHLLRKNAIQRILKRQIVIQGAITIKEQSSADISKHLITELIRAGYLPNNEIPETKIQEVALVIERYVKLKKYCLEDLKSATSEEKSAMKERNESVNWILSVAATDIEERLSNNRVNKTVVKDMFDILTRKIKLPTDSPYDKDRDIQIYLGVYRNYMKYDYGMLSYILFKYFNAGWNEATDETIKTIAANFQLLNTEIDSQMAHPLSGQINRVVSRYNVFFSIMVDVISNNPVAIYDSLKNDPKAFPRDVKKVCAKRYEEARSKLWRAALRSIIYIFITKSVFAVLLEVPATTLLGQSLNYVSLGINITFPAMLLFLIVLFMSLPSDDNTAKIISGIDEIIYKNRDELEPITLREPVKRGFGISLTFNVLYTITFFLSFGFVIWALNKINFNFVSITIFLFFLAFVSFFSVRIRKGARELIVVEDRESLFSFLVDFFYIPVAYTGKWLSEKFSRINVFVFILDFIIEAPFKVFVEIAEEWTKYVRERKDQII